MMAPKSFDAKVWMQVDGIEYEILLENIDVSYDTYFNGQTTVKIEGRGRMEVKATTSVDTTPSVPAFTSAEQAQEWLDAQAATG